MKTNKNKKSPMCRLCGTLGAAILVVLMLLCIPFALPKVLGYQAYTVISGSMEPAISIGSLLYVKDIEPKEVVEGDIIAFYGGRDTNAVITHRVVENKVEIKEFVTKGDANQTVDMNAVMYHHLIGKVEHVIPELGFVAQFITSPKGKMTAGCMVVAAVILQFVASLLAKPE